jgi:hypothetical protein
MRKGEIGEGSESARVGFFGGRKKEKKKLENQKWRKRKREKKRRKKRIKKEKSESKGSRTYRIVTRLSDGVGEQGLGGRKGKKSVKKKMGETPEMGRKKRKEEKRGRQSCNVHPGRSSGTIPAKRNLSRSIGKIHTKKYRVQSCDTTKDRRNKIVDP